MDNPFTCKHCDGYHKRGHREKACKDPEPEPIMYYPNRLDSTSFVWNPVGISQGIPVQHTAHLKVIIEEVIKKEEKKYYANLPTESTEPVVSYRVWRYQEGKLISAYMDTVWPGYKPMTRDLYKDEGIHGVKDYKKIPKLMRDYTTSYEPFAMFTSPKTFPMVAGSINMWGEVKEREIGYLSDYAYPKELYVGEDFDCLAIMDLEENYGVPVTIREELTRSKWPRNDVDLFGVARVSYGTYTLKSSINRTFFTYADPDDSKDTKGVDKDSKDSIASQTTAIVKYQGGV
jgi:hypothetical protein